MLKVNKEIRFNFSTALSIMVAGGVVARDGDKTLKAGASPGIDYSNLHWIKDVDMLATDWYLV